MLTLARTTQTQIASSLPAWLVVSGSIYSKSNLSDANVLSLSSCQYDESIDERHPSLLI